MATLVARCLSVLGENTNHSVHLDCFAKALHAAHVKKPRRDSTHHTYFLSKKSNESKAAATSCKCLLIVKQQLCKFKERKLDLKAQHTVTKPPPILEVKIKINYVKIARWIYVDFLLPFSLSPAGKFSSKMSQNGSRMWNFFASRAGMAQSASMAGRATPPWPGRPWVA